MEQPMDHALRAALDGGKAILEVYETADFGVEFKADDSPLTKADKQAHLEIVKELEKTEVPILSEEGKSWPTRSAVIGPGFGW